MGSRLMSLWREIRSWSRLHPSYEELLAQRDGELNEFMSRRIAAHLHRCARCQVERDRIEEDIRRFHSADARLHAAGVPPLSEGLARLQRAIQAGELPRFPAPAHAKPESRGEASASQRLAAELNIYLGSRAAAMLVQRTGGGSRDVQELVRAAESILKEFCGQATASAVATRISHIWNQYHGGERTQLHLPV